MIHALRLRPEAETDLRAAHQWYEGRRAGLGDEFLVEIDRSLTRIQATPVFYSETHKNVRRALVQRFPYGIFYLIEAETVVVLAVLHQARSPELWP